MTRHPFRFGLFVSPCLLAVCCSSLSAQQLESAPEPLVIAQYETGEAEITPIDEGPSAEQEYGEGDELSRETEVIRERYPSGSIKIERHIAEDAAGNLINHGRWTQWDPAGNVVGTGEFKDGKQDGRWVRYLADGEGKMFTAAPYKQFSRPFISEAEFSDGKLHGEWTVVDAKHRKVMHCDFTNNLPTGTSTWWYPNGQKMREVTYRDGKIDGEFLEWTPENQLAVADTYKEGRKHAVKIEWHSPGKKKSEGPFLFARQVSEETYDWWNAAVNSKVVGKEGADQRHGHWVWWYPNGMKKMEGEYEHGEPSGKFAWWYSNSQKYIEGHYEHGKQHGSWVWWHANGLTQFKGEYVSGHQSGRWTGYTETGKLIEVQDFDGSKPQQNAETTEPALNDHVEVEPVVRQPKLQALRSLRTPRSGTQRR